MRLKIRLISFFFITLFFIVLFRGTVFAADFKVTGTAIDDKNNPVVNATVTVKNTLTQQVVATANSDQNGYYTLSVPQGTYNIITSPPLGSGLQPTTYSHITISSDISLKSNLNAVGNAPTASPNINSQTTHSGMRPIVIALTVFIILILILLVGISVWSKKKKVSV